MKAPALVVFAPVALTVLVLTWVAFDWAWWWLEEHVIYPRLCRRIVTKYGVSERPCPHNERWVDCRGKCGRPLR